MHLQVKLEKRLVFSKKFGIMRTFGKWLLSASLSLTGTVHLVDTLLQVFAKFQARSCESLPDFLTPRLRRWHRTKS